LEFWVLGSELNWVLDRLSINSFSLLPLFFFFFFLLDLPEIDHSDYFRHLRTELKWHCWSGLNEFPLICYSKVFEYLLCDYTWEFNYFKPAIHTYSNDFWAVEIPSTLEVPLWWRFWSCTLKQTVWLVKSQWIFIK
jgi:hypothetical protein